jgi:MoxR-like ATPase
LLDGRHYFTHEDVQTVALGVLGHRLIIRPEAEVEGKTVQDVVAEVLETVPVLETKVPTRDLPLALPAEKEPAKSRS